MNKEMDWSRVRRNPSGSREPENLISSEKGSEAHYYTVIKTRGEL
jgi:hypothetical protein